MIDEELVKLWDGAEAWEIDGDLYIAHKLMFHWALLVNPDPWGYEHRYCYKDLPLMRKAMSEFIETGKLKYWHKDHTNGLSVNGKYLYEQGMLQEPKYSVGEVEWEVV